MAAQTNKSDSISRAVSNTPEITTAPIGIQTNAPIAAPTREYFKKFTSLNPTAEPLPQGDGVIRISPFDDYIIFTIFDETGENGELADTPIDLSNVGTLTLVFVGANDEIRIPNWTRVQDVDLSQGQVLFRISKEDSKKILALDNQNFYISTRMEDQDGTSDESVLYTGTFLNLQDYTKQNATDKLNQQALLYSNELTELNATIKRLNEELANMISLDQDQIATILRLKASNLELTNQVAELSNQLGSSKSEVILNNAKLAARSSDLAIKKRSQIKAIQKKTNKESNRARQARYIKQAAENLQEFNTAKNPVRDKRDIINGSSNINQ
tara:strand:+ start:1865 stop:2845 length:981 start_codon:yes stop_codon:yes gene_type:complete